MICQNICIENHEIAGLPFKPVEIGTPTELLTKLNDINASLDIEYSKKSKVLVFVDTPITFEIVFDRKIKNKKQRVRLGYGVIFWEIPYNEEFGDLFILLLNKWEEFTEYCFTHEISITEYEKQFNEMLKDFKNTANIELVIQLLNSLMS